MGGGVSKRKAKPSPTTEQEYADQINAAINSSNVEELCEACVFGHDSQLKIYMRDAFWLSQIVQSDLWTTVKWATPEARNRMLALLNTDTGRLVLFNRNIRRTAFDIALEFGASDFVMACVTAPAGTLDYKEFPSGHVVQWNVGVEYAKSRGTVQWLARHSAPCLDILFQANPPHDREWSEEARGYLHTLVDCRTHADASTPLTRQWLPRLDVFKVYLQHSKYDGSGMMVTQHDANGKTPAMRMAEYQRPLVMGQFSSEEEAKRAAEEDRVIARVMAMHEENVRRHPQLLATITAGALRCLPSELIIVIVEYAIIPPRPPPPLPTTRHHSCRPTTAAVAAKPLGIARAMAPTAPPLHSP